MSVSVEYKWRVVYHITLTPASGLVISQEHTCRVIISWRKKKPGVKVRSLPSSRGQSQQSCPQSSDRRAYETRLGEGEKKHNFPLIVTAAPLSYFQLNEKTHGTFDQKQGSLGLCSQISTRAKGKHRPPSLQKRRRFSEKLQTVLKSLESKIVVHYSESWWDPPTCAFWSFNPKSAHCLWRHQWLSLNFSKGKKTNYHISKCSWNEIQCYFIITVSFMKL